MFVASLLAFTCYVSSVAGLLVTMHPEDVNTLRSCFSTAGAPLNQLYELQQIPNRCNLVESVLNVVMCNPQGRIVKLFLANYGIGPTLSHVCAFPELETLDLRYNKLIIPSAVVFMSMPKLKELYLSGNIMRYSILDSLRRIPTLTDCSLTHEGGSNCVKEVYGEYAAICKSDHRQPGDLICAIQGTHVSGQPLTDKVYEETVALLDGVTVAPVETATIVATKAKSSHTAATSAGTTNATADFDHVLLEEAQSSDAAERTADANAEQSQQLLMQSTVKIVLIAVAACTLGIALLVCSVLISRRRANLPAENLEIACEVDIDPRNEYSVIPTATRMRRHANGTPVRDNEYDSLYAQLESSGEDAESAEVTARGHYGPMEFGPEESPPPPFTNVPIYGLAPPLRSHS